MGMTNFPIGQKSLRLKTQIAKSSILLTYFFFIAFSAIPYNCQGDPEPSTQKRNNSGPRTFKHVIVTTLSGIITVFYEVKTKWVTFNLVFLKAPFQVLVRRSLVSKRDQGQYGPKFNLLDPRCLHLMLCLKDPFERDSR